MGMEDMVSDYHDYLFHIKGFFIGEAMALANLAGHRDVRVYGRDDVEDWLAMRGYTKISCIYGCSMGGAVVLRFLADGRIGTETWSMAGLPSCSQKSLQGP